MPIIFGHGTSGARSRISCGRARAAAPMIAVTKSGRAERFIVPTLREFAWEPCEFSRS